VYKFGFKLVQKETRNKWRLFERWSCSDGPTCMCVFTRSMFSPNRCRECYGTMSKLYRSNALSWFGTLTTNWRK